MEIVKSVFFFYYCFILPCVWLGKKIIWGVIRDTEKQKTKATKAVLEKAKRKGNLGKYNFDVTEQVKELYKEPEDKKKSKKNKEKTKKNKAREEESSSKGSKESSTKFQGKNSDAGKSEQSRKSNIMDNKSAGITSGSDSEDSVDDDSYYSFTDTDNLEAHDNSGKELEEDLVSEQW